MHIKKAIFENLLQQASFQFNGDLYEHLLGNLIITNFPNCERFWKLFVLPLTERISGYPNNLTNNIRPRQGVDADLENIANTNYTTFLNLAYAHIHLQADMLSSLENFYSHLGSACDLVETFLERWFFLLMKCRGDESEMLQQLTRKDFLKLAGDWYDKKYQGLYEYYFSKGKVLPIRIPSRKNIIKELFKKYLKNDDLRKQYVRFSQSIREFRNVVVHDVQVGRLNINGQIYIPKPQVIKKYRTWREVFSVINELDIIAQDFNHKKLQMESDIVELETILNGIWDLILNEFLSEFYTHDRHVLRGLYGLVLDDD